MEKQENNSKQGVSQQDNQHEQHVDDMENKRGIQREILGSRFMLKNIFRTQTAASTILGILFAASLICLPFIFGHYFKVWFSEDYVFLGFMAGFGGTILFAIISSIVWRNLNRYAAKKDKNAKEIVGTVIASSFLAEHRIASGGNTYTESRKVLGTIYKVKIKAGDKKVIGYARNKFYEKGEQILIRYNPKRPWRCFILQGTKNLNFKDFVSMEEKASRD